ncbi:Bgt-249 [Blumeria graminis f. sp. tritici]|uniref:Bgt-249 n=2 Tax=Blumeria graminis f. sp. tritici TaxID=62690 RepID=A0A381LGH7_BLUGR|nr:hypothetical protein BGT96224_249 [Blumeria graminis f. sp. tritici 96224]VDB92863.1 Bgt-249 [Blumeria graminis f. sp. tritici]
MLFRISYLFPLTQLAICVSALSWNFDEAIISITGKAGSRQAFKDKYAAFEMILIVQIMC